MSEGADEGPGAHVPDLHSAPIGRQLHDIVVPQLFVVATGLATLRQRDDPTGSSELVDDLADTAAKVLADLRAISRGHLVNEGGRLARVAARLELATQTVAQLTGCAVDVVVDGDARLSASLDDDVTAVVWEAIANAIRHGAATHVDVGLRSLDDTLRVVVSDNGRWSATETAAGTGLQGLERRATARGGSLVVHHGGAGTRLDWHVPLAP